MTPSPSAPHAGRRAAAGLAALVASAFVLARGASAQPAPTTPATPGATGAPAPTTTGTTGPVVGPPPPQWASWAIGGQLLPGDDAATVEGVLDDAMQTHRALTQSAFDELALSCKAIGYQLLRIDTKPVEGGVHAVLVVAAIPMVRSVAVDVKSESVWSPFTQPVFDDEIKRRMRLRPGAYLAYDPPERKVQLDEEVARIEDYLHDEGYFDATATMLPPEKVDPPGVRIKVVVRLGRAYKVGDVRVTGVSAQSPVSADEIADAFRHEGRLCVFGRCVIGARFTRAQHLADQAAVTAMYQKGGFPAVKVTTDFDPATSFDRRSGTVGFTVRVDERRQVDVVFEGNDPTLFPEGDLKGKLTFDDAASADDYEIAASALAIQRYYQSHGHFDAIVTWSRERFRLVDHVVFRIDEGPVREIQRVDFAAVDGDLAISADKLADTVNLRGSSFFGGGGYVSPTAQTLAADAERLRRLYVSQGWGEARVAVRVGPDAEHLGSPAQLAALIAAGRGDGDLYVRFDIAQGPRTLLDTVEVTFVGEHRGSCAAALDQLGDSLDLDHLSARATPGQPCRASVAGLAVPSLPDQLDGARGKLKDWFWSLGKPRAEASLAVTRAPGDPHRSVATFTVTEHGDVHIGKVLVRGNFRTKTSVILGELGFVEGRPLTGELYSSGPRRLRAMNLFANVNVELIGFEDSDADRVDVLVRVEERNDAFAQIDLEAGYTQINGDYARVTTTIPNPYGTGTSFVLSATAPLHWVPPVLYLLDADAKFISLDGSLKIPRWRVRKILPVAADLELTGFLRQQDTPRFGQLLTKGTSAALSRVWQQPRTDTHDARSLSATLRFDFRDRQRDQDAIRVIGPRSDAAQAPVGTRTGAIGVTFVYDRRLDARGNLNPLIPDRGYKLEAGASFASPYLLGQDTFFKINAAGSSILTVNDRLQLHFDGKLDEGFPLGGAVLLPEVERFFAGGDTTVRGFAEDRLATEIVEVGVPPFGSVQQIRVLPAGGNIRALATIDAQVRVWKLAGLPVATALFVDAGLVTNTWAAVTPGDIRPAVGVSLLRLVSPLGAISIDYAIPLRPRLGDNPLGFVAFSVALRN